MKSDGAQHDGKFRPAFDSRNKRVPGIKVRNGRFYGQIWAARSDGKGTARNFPLFKGDGKSPVETLSEAREAYEKIRHARREGDLPPAGRKPTLREFFDIYRAKARQTKRVARRPATVGKENGQLARWVGALGATRIDRIDRAAMAAFVDARISGGASPRTADLDLIALRNLLKCAVEQGIIRDLPSFPKIERQPPPRRTLLARDDLARLLGACLATGPAGKPVTRNGEQVRDYLRFLAFSGAREQEALRVRWSDVDSAGGRLTLGGDGLAKNWQSRTVEFSQDLAALIAEMRARRAPDSSWLFPSPQRGQKDARAKTFRASLRAAAAAAGLGGVGFHDLRHYFASECVMAGIDFMTIAAWLGHKDGGMLVGKVYGHLRDDHRREAARKVRFGFGGNAGGAGAPPEAAGQQSEKGNVKP